MVASSRFATGLIALAVGASAAAVRFRSANVQRRQQQPWAATGYIYDCSTGVCKSNFSLKADDGYVSGAPGFDVDCNPILHLEQSWAPCVNSDGSSTDSHVSAVWYEWDGDQHQYLGVYHNFQRQEDGLFYQAESLTDIVPDSTDFAFGFPVPDVVNVDSVDSIPALPQASTTAAPADQSGADDQPSNPSEPQADPQSNPDTDNDTTDSGTVDPSLVDSPGYYPVPPQTVEIPSPDVTPEPQADDEPDSDSGDATTSDTPADPAPTAEPPTGPQTDADSGSDTANDTPPDPSPSDPTPADPTAHVTANLLAMATIGPVPGDGA